MVIKFINLKELLENLILVINSKKIIKRYKKLDITCIKCDGLHAWLQTQSQFIAMVSSLIARRWVRLNDGSDVKL